MHDFIERHNDQMKKMIAIIWIIMTVTFFCIVPMTTIRNTVISENQVSYDQTIPSIAHGYQLIQQFVPQFDDIEHIDIYVNALECDKNNGYILGEIRDSDQTLIYKKKIALSDLPDYGWISIVSDIGLQAGETYYLFLDAIDTIDDGPKISFYASEVAASEEEKEQMFTYAAFPLENSMLKARFQYGIELPKTDYIVYYLFLSFVIFMILSRFPLRKE